LALATSLIEAPEREGAFDAATDTASLSQYVHLHSAPRGLSLVV
jgi:hypothetical protein